jgi:transcriptional regulator with XRE-family HTH domain
MSHFMAKPISRPYCEYSLKALELFGQIIREERLVKELTTTELAQRAGISRALLQRIERGDPGCSIGAVFEVAVICGVPLIESDQQQLTTRLMFQREKMRLLPKAVRTPAKEINDDF